jgi:four helix bundle protein
MTPLFDHEKLRVYQDTLRFITWLQPVFESVPKGLAVRDQLDRASTSIPLNIAEGNGKFTERDRCKFFDNARGSALECAACLDVLVVKLVVAPDLALRGKEQLAGIVSMLVGLIKSNSSSRVYEERADYEVSNQG